MTPDDCGIEEMRLEWEPAERGLAALDGHGAWVAGRHGETLGVIQASNLTIRGVAGSAELRTGDHILHDHDMCREGRNGITAVNS